MQTCDKLHFPGALQVIWVDLLTQREFEAGFGSHTPMFSGQTKCVRYYMNFERALQVMKAVLLKVMPGPGLTMALPAVLLCCALWCSRQVTNHSP